MFKELRERWAAELPEFWIKVRNGSLWMSGALTTVWTANQSMSLNLPEVLLTICKYGIVIGLVTGFNAQMTKK